MADTDRLKLAIIAVATWIHFFVFIGVVYGTDRTIDIPVTVSYWSVRPNKTFSGTTEDRVIGSSALLGTVLTPLIVNLIAATFSAMFDDQKCCGGVNVPQRISCFKVGWKRLLAFGDECAFSVMININLAIMIGMTDFSQLFNLGVLSVIPPTFVVVAAGRQFWNKGAEKGVSTFVGMDVSAVYRLPVWLAVFFTMVNYVTILLVHHYAPNSNAVTHAAVYFTVASQLVWRAVAVFSHDGKHDSVVLERAWAMIAVIVCVELAFWAI